MTGPSSSAPSGFANHNRAHRPRRKLPWVIGGLLAALLVAGFWPGALPVEVATVGRGDLLVTVNEEGMTRVKNRYVVSSPVAGQLRRIDWKAGAVVEAGKTILAILETRGADLLDASGQAQAEARVRGAESSRDLAGAQLERARAAHSLALSDLARVRELFGRGALSRQDLDISTMREATTAEDVRAAEFAQQVAEFELQQARALLLRGQPGGNVKQEPLVVVSPVRDPRAVRFGWNEAAQPNLFNKEGLPAMPFRVNVD